MAGTDQTWSTAFEAIPAISDAPKDLPDQMNDLKVTIRTKLEKEHKGDTSGGTAFTGEHIAGSAMAYSQSAAPTTRPDGTTLSTEDEGRLWLGEDKNLSRWDGSAWKLLTVTTSSATIHEASTTTGVIYTLLSPFVPEIGDSVPVSGGRIDGSANRFTVFSHASRTNSSTILLRGLRSLSSPAVAGELTFTTLNAGATTSVTNISLSVSAVS